MMMNEYHFYDTSSLLMRASNLFDIEENIIISTITLQELENIKSSNDKEPAVKMAARHILNKLRDHPKAYQVLVYSDEEEILAPIRKMRLPINNDTRILGSAIYYDKNIHPDETIFYTNDLSLAAIANLFFGDDSIRSISEEQEYDYSGYKEIIMNDKEMADFYSHLENNPYNLFIN